MCSSSSPTQLTRLLRSPLPRAPNIPRAPYRPSKAPTDCPSRVQRQSPPTTAAQVGFEGREGGQAVDERVQDARDDGQDGGADFGVQGTDRELVARRELFVRLHFAFFLFLFTSHPFSCSMLHSAPSLVMDAHALLPPPVAFAWVATTSSSPRSSSRSRWRIQTVSGRSSEQGWSPE
jgi:hypothetical protein